jgi:hypothetical protein
MNFRRTLPATDRTRRPAGFSFKIDLLEFIAFEADSI